MSWPVEFRAVGRVVQPELLDELPFDDPDALRSRRDLRFINGVMGNFRWMRRRLAGRAEGRVIELGAGDGAFLRELPQTGLELVGLDLAPRPTDLPPEIKWVQGDVQEVLAENVKEGGIVVANHLLHHFEEAQLRDLGRTMRRGEEIHICEPLRALRTRVQGVSLWPLLNRVTRYDMLVSIRAGFRRGELPELLGIEPGEWELTERCTLRGAYRLSARRRRR
ncbi:MAG: class I SAM-dependent methyltransferase [Roseibacillus sp.]